jgi:hypothetical protein
MNYLNFEIDKLTHSIENVITGDSFATNVLRLSKGDLKQITKKNGWNFNWRTEANDPTKDVFKLIIEHNVNIIQGLISLTILQNYVIMHLLESAPFNIRNNKVYQGVAGNLVAYACKLSFLHGFDGNVLFFAKTKLISHYEQSLGAVHIGGQRMIIYTKEALLLVKKYFNDFKI